MVKISWLLARKKLSQRDHWPTWSNTPRSLQIKIQSSLDDYSTIFWIVWTAALFFVTYISDFKTTTRILFGELQVVVLKDYDEIFLKIRDGLEPTSTRELIVIKIDCDYSIELLWKASLDNKHATYRFRRNQFCFLGFTW